MNGADWSKRYPRIVEEAAGIKGHAIIDAEVVCLDSKGVAQFDLLHNRSNDDAALALGFDLLALNGKDLRKRPLVERKTALSKLLIRSKGGIQYVEHADGHGERMFAAVCRLGLEGIVSKLSMRLIVRDRRGPGLRSKTRRHRCHANSRRLILNSENWCCTTAAKELGDQRLQRFCNVLSAKFRSARSKPPC